MILGIDLLMNRYLLTASNHTLSSAQTPALNISIPLQSSRLFQIPRHLSAKSYLPSQLINDLYSFHVSPPYSRTSQSRNSLHSVLAFFLHSIILLLHQNTLNSTMTNSLTLHLPIIRPTRRKCRFLCHNCPSTSPSFLNKPLAVTHYGKRIDNFNNVLFVSQYAIASLHRRLRPVPALDSDLPQPLPQGSVNIERSKSFEEWNSWTAKFSGAANIPFLLLQLPQIILNARNLLAGNNTALWAVPWLGMLTGLLGNLSLVSYFAKKKETEAVVVQTLGVVSTYVVISQLAMAEAMPLPHFVTTSVVVVTGLLLNFLNYFDLLNAGIWRLWEDFITIGGITVLPQVMWSTFVPYIPNSILPGAISFAVGLVAVIMARIGKLSEKGVKFVGAISGWTATLLFMWMPVSQMWTNFLNPENIKGLSAISMLLAMIGNGLMIPRALFIRDIMWFTGSAWASFFYGYGNIVCLYCCNVISREFFLAATVGLLSWTGMAFWRDTVAYGHSSPLQSLKELVSGR